MTVDCFVKASGFKILSLPHPDKEIDGVYVGDLLSWVMGRADAGNLWITIMSNVNVIAVGSLADTSAIILAEEVTLEEDVLSVAIEKGINILSSSLPVYETALKTASCLS